MFFTNIFLFFVFLFSLSITFIFCNNSGVTDEDLVQELEFSSTGVPSDSLTPNESSITEREQITTLYQSVLAC